MVAILLTHSLICKANSGQGMSHIDESEEPLSRNIVYIGRKKPVMNYVLAALTCLGNSPNVILKARGMAISLAVDVAEITVHRFGSGIRVAGVKTDTERMVLQEGGSRDVSTIEIELTTAPITQGIVKEPTPISASQPVSEPTSSKP